MRPDLYIVRHGETDWNREGRLQGQRDIPMNDLGRAQAARNGRALKAVLNDPAALSYVASPLGRARETMEIVRAALGLDPAAHRTDERLKELTFGVWEGLTLEELKLRDPAAYRARRERRWHVIPPQGESYAMLTERVEAALKDVESEAVLVAHGGVMRAARVLLCGADPVEAAYLPTPQDRIMAIRREKLEWI